MIAVHQITIQVSVRQADVLYLSGLFDPCDVIPFLTKPDVPPPTACKSCATNDRRRGEPCGSCRAPTPAAQFRHLQPALRCYGTFHPCRALALALPSLASRTLSICRSRPRSCPRPLVHSSVCKSPVRLLLFMQKSIEPYGPIGRTFAPPVLNSTCAVTSPPWIQGFGATWPASCIESSGRRSTTT